MELSLEIAVWGLIALVGIGLVYETLFSKKSKNAPAPQNKMITANEAGPTLTGRFRAQQVIKEVPEKTVTVTSGQKEILQAQLSSPTTEEEEEILPDPFSSGKS